MGQRSPVRASEDRRAAVILLNGTSSVGKTTVARALQRALPEPFLLASVDTFIEMHPDRSQLGAVAPAPGGGVRIRLTDAGRALMRGFHDAVAVLVDAGHRVIVDDLILDRDLRDDWLRALSGKVVLSVGLRCSLEECERREAERAERTPGLARGYHLAAHERMAYDLEVHTDAAGVEECATAIAACWRDLAPPRAWEGLRARPDPVLFERAR